MSRFMVSVFSISLCRCLILVKPQAFINGSERFCDKVSEGVCLYLQAIRPKKKKDSLASGNQLGENIFITYPSA